MQNFCTQCGFELPGQVQFCPNCGVSVKSPNSPNQNAISVTGNISGDLNLAGRDISRIYNNFNSNQDLSNKAFINIYRFIEDMGVPEKTKETVKEAIKEIESEDRKEKPNPDNVNRWLQVVEKIAPKVAQMLFEFAVSQTPSLSSGLQSVIRAIRHL